MQSFTRKLTLFISKRRMYHDLTDPLIKAFRFQDKFAPWQASYCFKIAFAQYSGGLGSSAPGISLSCNLSSCSAQAMLKMRPPKQSHKAIQKDSLPCLPSNLKVDNSMPFPVLMFFALFLNVLV